MLEPSILIFVTTSVFIILSPGQDMVLVLSHSISRGSKAGVITAAGVSIGLLGHTILATLGLGALLQASEIAFTLMKYIGAAYLFYLGIKLFRTPTINLSSTSKAQGKLRKLFIIGAFSNLSNPKIAIFYFAYLPQFVSPSEPHSAQTLFMLGALFALMTFMIKFPIGIVAGKLSTWIQERPSVQAWINRSCGGVMIAMGLRLASESQQG